MNSKRSSLPLHRLFTGSLCVVLFCSDGGVSPLYAQVPAIAAASALSGLISGLKGLVKQVEDSGHSLIEHGNVALGQQQVLLASTLSATINQFEEAYKNSLTTTFDKVDVQTQNAYRSLHQLVKNADAIRSSTVIDAQNLIYKTQGAANQLLGTLPLVSRRPVYYGFTTRDILAAAHATPADIEILGFYLTDSELKYRKPKIQVAETTIPDDQVDAQFDRVKVQLPDDLRKKLRLANTPCEPIKTFSVKIHVFYTNHPWLSRASTYFDSEATFDGQASPGKPLYEITAEFIGTKTTTASAASNFSVSSGQVNVGCEETHSTSAQWTAPAGATQLNPTAGWANTSNLKSQSQGVVVTGLTATATGSVTGLDKQFWNCPGGGHGELILHGTYAVPVTSTGVFSQTALTTAMRESSIVVPSGEGVKLTDVTVRFRRKECPNLFDEMTFAVPEDPNRNVQQTTKNGYFTVSYDRGNLTITGTDLLAGQ